MTFEKKMEIKMTFEKRKNVIIQGIKACMDNGDKAQLERLRARLSELELWEDYVMKLPNTRGRE